MSPIAACSTRLLDPTRAVSELAAGVAARLGPDVTIAGAMLLSNGAAGPEAARVAGALAAGPWSGVELLGTGFEGLIAEGRSWRDEPALVAIAWSEGRRSPLPIAFEDALPPPAELAEELSVSGIDRPPTPGDLLLVFPDALGTTDAAAWLAELARLLHPMRIAGAAASGPGGGPAVGWHADGPFRAGLVGLLLPGPMEAEPFAPPWLRSVGGTRAASPWLEVTGCRPRWIDGLEEEPALDWVRRQLGLEPGDPVEPHLDRLLVRIRPGGAHTAGCAGDEAASDREVLGETPTSGAAAAVDYEERYVVGVDGRRGAISVPATVRRGDRVALALPDAALAREGLRGALRERPEADLILQLGCRARDAGLHGDDDLESALVAHAAGPDAPPIVGTISPWQIGPDGLGPCRPLVHATVLAAIRSS
ncbi:MAG: FIST C-terminal domain-containing protein [Myxococcota bacterium]